MSTGGDAQESTGGSPPATVARMRLWPLALAVAQRQHLHLARWQLRLLSLSDQAVSRRVREEGWSRPHAGVVALPGPPDPLRSLAAATLRYSYPTHAPERVKTLLQEGLQPEEALTAAALNAGQLVCGPSAAWLHGLVDVVPATAWLRLPTGDGHDRAPGIRLRYGSVPASERTMCQGLPTTSVGLTIRDLAGLRTPEHHRRRLLRTLIATGEARRLTTVAALVQEVEFAARFRGRPLLRQVLAELAGSLSHSRTEAHARQLVAAVVERHGLVLHPQPYPIRCGGRIVAEADLAILELRYDVEVDGPHHLLPAQQARDRRRDREARRAGWTVDRFLVDEVEADPAGFAAAVEATITALLRSRGDLLPQRK